MLARLTLTWPYTTFGRLRDSGRVCYTAGSGDEAEEYLPGRRSASRGQCKPGGQAAGKGAVELRFLSDRWYCRLRIVGCRLGKPLNLKSEI